ncbi:MAG TPA: sugar ABC transporter ATP-binding protein [Vicinamibacteria bacterium]|nr:sugar ABC transporter ATP-binding protein [Vicinamibacteria bacterium]
MSTPAVRFEGITKRFPGALALEDVSFDVARGSCHALCGENGAGKSTLGRILAGIHAPDGGRLIVEGREVRFEDPRAALAAGIGMVHQELAFCDNLSVAENLCLSHLPRRGVVVSRDQMRRRARQLLQDVGAEAIDVTRRAGELTVGQQQMVQIAAAVGSGARIVVFDEPTSSLSRYEADRLYELIGRLRARGVTCLYVSHRLEEIFRLCDTVTVLRDGRHVATQPAAQLDEGALVRLMIGRTLEEYFPGHLAAQPGAELLRVEGFSSPGRFAGVSLAVRAGEVLGLAGLVGAGRSELAQAIFGLDPEARGRVFVEGRPVAIRSPAYAMRLGLGLVPEDRKRQGLVLTMSALANTTLPILPRLARLSWILRRQEHRLGGEQFERLRVRTPDLGFVAAGLSGGNQQKIVMAKWLAARCRILLLDEPTRGVDVGAKAELHALIDRLAAQGSAVLLISSELPELIALSTRIVVLREGRVAGELSHAEASQESLMRLMAGTKAA